MKPADRGMKRCEFRRILRSELTFESIDISGFKGIAGVLDIFDTDGAWAVSSSLGSSVIAAPGYKWLQLAPDHGKWWLTVMFDVQGQLVQYYFDVIKCRYLSDSGEPRFIDMYLDIVMGPDGRYEVMDRSDLNAAFRSGVITEFDYRRALSILYELTGSIHNKEQYWRSICEAAFAEMDKKGRG